MSDGRGKPKPEELASTTIPPGLEGFVQKRAWPKTSKPGDNPALDAAVAAYTVSEKELGVVEAPPVQDLSRGMGNASAYVAPIAVPAAKAGASAAAPGKVALGMNDVPRALPEGSATGQTVETRGLWKGTPPPRPAARVERVEEEGKPAPAASPWAKDTPAPEAVRVSALPSSLRPRDVPAPGSDAPARVVHAVEPPHGRGRGALVVVGAIVVVAIGITVRAMTGGPEPQGAVQKPATTATTSAAVASAPATAAAPMVTAQERIAPPPSSAPSTSSAVPVAPPSVAPVPSIPRPTGKRPEPRGEDPYADAAAPPVKTAAPVVTAPVVTAPVVTAAPPVTAPVHSAQPTPPSPPPEPTIKPVF